MVTRDQNFYPVPHGKFVVTDQDENGNPTKTKFYHRDDHTKHVFSWDQTWNESGKCMSWEITDIELD